MKFSHDTSRLVKGRWYWYAPTRISRASRTYFYGVDYDQTGFWGDECPAPTVEVEPSPPAWVPPVCPAGQAILDNGVSLLVVTRGGPLATVDRYPKPAWPPRIGEIVEVLIRTSRDPEVWLPVMVTSGPVGEFSGERVESGGRALHRDLEGKQWRWVYRDLSGYVPPGGA